MIRINQRNRFFTTLKEGGQVVMPTINQNQHLMEVVTNARKDCGFSRKELAKACNDSRVDYHTIQQLETEGCCSASKLRIVAETLGIEARTLLSLRDAHFAQLNRKPPKEKTVRKIHKTLADLLTSKRSTLGITRQEIMTRAGLNPEKDNEYQIVAGAENRGSLHDKYIERFAVAYELTTEEIRKAKYTDEKPQKKSVQTCAPPIKPSADNKITETSQKPASNAEEKTDVPAKTEPLQIPTEFSNIPKKYDVIAAVRAIADSQISSLSLQELLAILHFEATAKHKIKLDGDVIRSLVLLLRR